jgi:hypothetical protein
LGNLDSQRGASQPIDSRLDLVITGRKLECERLALPHLSPQGSVNLDAVSPEMVAPLTYAADYDESAVLRIHSESLPGASWRRPSKSASLPLRGVPGRFLPNHSRR